MKTEENLSVALFEQVVLRGCGLDVHVKTVVATIDGEGIVRETKTFDSYTSSLNELREWLQLHRVILVAMGSAGGTESRYSICWMRAFITGRVTEGKFIPEKRIRE